MTWTLDMYMDLDMDMDMDMDLDMDMDMDMDLVDISKSRTSIAQLLFSLAAREELFDSNHFRRMLWSSFEKVVFLLSMRTRKHIVISPQSSVLNLIAFLLWNANSLFCTKKLNLRCFVVNFKNLNTLIIKL